MNVQGDATASHGGWSRASAWPLLALGIYGVALVVYRPLSPFEWDEILFMQAMSRFDVAAHSPHPPGYPVYVGLAKPLHWLTGDAQLALQLVAMIGALTALSLLWFMARHLGASRRQASFAVALLATTPAFVFNANVGMSDVLGTAGALAGVFALVASWDRPERLPLAAVVCAIAVGVRPQVAAALLAVAAVVLVRAALAGRWRSMLAAVASGVAVSAACWLPAVLLTGPARFIGALRGQLTWVVEIEHAGQLSRASLGTLVDRWLVAPFGSAVLAAVFWALVVAGATALWRGGKRRLVAVCISAGGGYLVFAVWALHIDPSVRYALPAVPFLALLAGGLGNLGGIVSRRAVAATVAIWCLLAVAVVAGPALDLRRRRPAPVAAAMAWVIANFEPEHTTVVCSGVLRPHATLVLAPAGFEVVAEKPGQRPVGARRPGVDVLLLTSSTAAGTEVLFDSHWDVPELSRLTRGRYERCVVARARPAQTKPSAGDQVLSAVTPATIAAARNGSELVVPAAAHAQGKLGSFWTTDLVIRNSDPGEPLTVELSVVARPEASACAAPVTLQLPPGATLALPDVLHEQLRCSGFAALRLRSGQAFTAFWRTFDRRRVVAGTSPDLLSALTSAEASDRGTFELGPAWPARGGARCNLGFVNLANRAADVELEVVCGNDVTLRRAHVPAASSVQVDGVAEGCTSHRMRIEFRATSRLLAYASVVETATGSAVYLFP